MSNTDQCDVDDDDAPVPAYKLEDDGVTHINVYSRGKTKLGQLLSNFANIGFSHPRLGRFQSVEAFWYYIKTGCKHEELRNLHGYQAKMAGQKLEVVKMSTRDFHARICEAITCKVEQNPKLLDLLLEAHLPFTHYYVFERMGAPVIVFQPKQQWQLDHLETLRRKWLHTDRSE